MGPAVNTLADCTLPEKILLAAHHLEEKGQSPFSAEALIVASWQKYPATFGLKGYEEQYPDSNKVLAGIMGEKGLPRRGFLSKMGQKLYELTKEGRQVVRRLNQDEEVPPPPVEEPKTLSKVTLPRDQDLLIQAMLAGPAWNKFRTNRHQEWTFSEACKFWNMGERSGDAVDGRLKELHQKLGLIERTLAGGQVTLGNGRTVTSQEVGQLAEIHRNMEHRFTRHLNLLRSRSGA
jgi:hypothetical protein